MENKASLYSGCLLGVAVGDAMGYPVDKKSWDEICQTYGPNGLLGYDLANGSAEITSYTQLAAFVCNGLLLQQMRGSTRQHEQYTALALREWAKSQQFRTVTEKTKCWVAQVPGMRRRLCMDTRMLDALNRQTLGTPEAPVLVSATPGALTGALAAGLCLHREEKALAAQIGARTVAMTHGDPEAFVSGGFIACAVAGILQQPESPLQQVYEEALQLVEELFAAYPQTLILAQRIRKAFSLTRDPELTPLAAMTVLGCTTAGECVAGAVYASIIHSGNFDEAMIAAVNHSGRSSAVASLTGGLLGARLGQEALPEFYLESLENSDVLLELAEDLVQGRQLSRIFDDRWDQKYIQGMPAH